MRTFQNLERLVRESGDQLDAVSLLFLDWLVQSGRWGSRSDLEVAHLPAHLFPGLVSVLQLGFPHVPRLDYVRPPDGRAVVEGERVDLDIESSAAGFNYIRVVPSGVLLKDSPCRAHHRE